MRWWLGFSFRSRRSVDSTIITVTTTITVPRRNRTAPILTTTMQNCTKMNRLLRGRIVAGEGRIVGLPRLPPIQKLTKKKNRRKKRIAGW